ncbi:MAG: DUF6482 family protein [Haliea sp.]|uniref:DUF6482 family protein n=1 Tax=Haliea sp. TaxID=1932666 RepID=UPI0032ED72C3
MKITLQQLQNSVGLTRVIVHSLDFSIYIAYAAFGEETFLVADTEGKPLRTRNLTAMKQQLAGVAAPELYLRHESAYDEMVGQPGRAGANALEIPLSRDWGDFPEGG